MKAMSHLSLGSSRLGQMQKLTLSLFDDFNLSLQLESLIENGTRLLVSLWKCFSSCCAVAPSSPPSWLQVPSLSRFRRLSEVHLLLIWEPSDQRMLPSAGKIIRCLRTLCGTLPNNEAYSDPPGVLVQMWYFIWTLSGF